MSGLEPGAEEADSIDGAIAVLASAVLNDLRDRCRARGLPDIGGREALVRALLGLDAGSPVVGPSALAQQVNFLVVNNMIFYGTVAVPHSSSLWSLLVEVARVTVACPNNLDVWIATDQVLEGQWVRDVVAQMPAGPVVLHVRRTAPRHSYLLLANPNQSLGVGIWFGGRAVWPYMVKRLPQRRYNFRDETQVLCLSPLDNPIVVYRDRQADLGLPEAPHLHWRPKGPLGYSRFDA